MKNQLLVAVPADKALVVELLASAFAENKSVHDALRPGPDLPARIRVLMEYAFETGMDRQAVFISPGRQGAAICYNPKDKPARSAVPQLIRLLHRAIGWRRLPYMLRKEKRLAAKRPAGPHLYLSFIGVHPQEQGKGTGGAMIEALKAMAAEKRLPIYLETSAAANVRFYERHGFEVFDKWPLRDAYTIHFIRYVPA